MIHGPGVEPPPHSLVPRRHAAEHEVSEARCSSAAAAGPAKGTPAGVPVFESDSQSGSCDSEAAARAPGRHRSRSGPPWCGPLAGRSTPVTGTRRPGRRRRSVAVTACLYGQGASRRRRRRRQGRASLSRRAHSGWQGHWHESESRARHVHGGATRCGGGLPRPRSHSPLPPPGPSHRHVPPATRMGSVSAATRMGSVSESQDHDRRLSPGPSVPPSEMHTQAQYSPPKSPKAARLVALLPYRGALYPIVAPHSANRRPRPRPAPHRAHKQSWKHTLDSRPCQCALISVESDS